MRFSRRDTAAGVVLVAATLACGLAAGFFYAYEVSVSRGLALLDDAEYIAAMQAINATVRNAAFAVSFFGTMPLIVAALVIRPVRRPVSVNVLIGAALGTYVVGAVIVTMAFNVPMNEQLATYTDLTTVDAGAIRDDYEAPWNAWNLVRMFASIAAFGALGSALCLEHAVRTTRMGSAAGAPVVNPVTKRS